MLTSIRNIVKRHPRTAYICYLLAVIPLLDFVMAQVFWKQLATHPEYFAKGFRGRHPYFHHALERNVRTIDAWQDLYSVNTNSLGFKDAEVRNVPLAADRPRILIIGDSFTEGLGYPYEKTFAGIIAKAMAERNIEVLNAAVVSYSPKLYYLKTRYLLERERLRFDTLVVFLDMSDVQDEIVYENFKPSDRAPGWVIPLAVKRYLIRNSVIGNVADVLLRRHRERAGRPANQEDDMYGSEDGTPDAENALLYGVWKDHDEFSEERSEWYAERNFARWGRKGTALAANYLKALADLCREERISMAVAVYPWPQQIADDPAGRTHVRFWKRFARESGVAFIDLYSMFLSRNADAVFARYYLPGDIHFNERGHELMAQKFLEWFQRNGEQSRSVPCFPAGSGKGAQGRGMPQPQGIQISVESPPAIQ